MHVFSSNKFHLVKFLDHVEINAFLKNRSAQKRLQQVLKTVSNCEGIGEYRYLKQDVFH